MRDVHRLPVGEDSEVAVTLHQLAREGARRMIATALEAEVADDIERFADERDEDGRRLVVRNGHARERRVTVGSGTVPSAHRGWTTSASTRRPARRILPAYARRSPKVDDVLPVLYLRGAVDGRLPAGARAAAR